MLRSKFTAVFSAFAVMCLLSVAPEATAGTAYDEAYEVVSEGTIQPGAPVPAPKGPVVLTVQDQDGNRVSFDMATLEQIGLVKFTTKTEWTDGQVEFEGVLLKDLLAVLGAGSDAEKLVLKALNDYISSMPISDAADYPVILAIKEDGEYMSVRDRGPLWVVYPQDAFPEVGRREFLSRWVWQLAEIAIE